MIIQKKDVSKNSKYFSIREIIIVIIIHHDFYFSMASFISLETE